MTIVRRLHGRPGRPGGPRPRRAARPLEPKESLLAATVVPAHWPTPSMAKVDGEFAALGGQRRVPGRPPRPAATSPRSPTACRSTRDRVGQVDSGGLVAGRGRDTMVTCWCSGRPTTAGTDASSVGSTAELAAAFVARARRNRAARLPADARLRGQQGDLLVTRRPGARPRCCGWRRRSSSPLGRGACGSRPSGSAAGPCTRRRSDSGSRTRSWTSGVSRPSGRRARR